MLNRRVRKLKEQPEKWHDILMTTGCCCFQFCNTHFIITTQVIAKT